MRKGEKMSEEQKNKILLSRKGYKHSDETKEKLKKAHLGKKRGPHSVDHKEKISKSNKGKHDNSGVKNPMYGKPSPNTGKKASEVTKQKMREWRIANPNRKFKDTKIELKIEEELRKRGINYEKQVPLCKIAIVDFYLPEYRIVIQADGCYWHGCLCRSDSIKDHCDKDKKQDLVLTFNGFNVYRFWEHEINESVEGCINRLML